MSERDEKRVITDFAVDIVKASVIVRGGVCVCVCSCGNDEERTHIRTKLQ